MPEVTKPPHPPAAVAAANLAQDAVRAIMERAEIAEQSEAWMYGESRTWMEPTASSADAKSFLELFAGVGNLSAAVKRAGAKVMKPLDS